MGAVPGYKASINITSNPSVSMTNEAMTDSGDHKTYNVTNSAHQCWDNSAAFVVQTAPDGSTWTTVTTGFTINYAIGQIVFTNAVTGATPSCRINSGKYFSFAFLGFAKEWDINLQGNMLDSTAFTSPSSQWKTFVPGMLNADVKLIHWWIDGTFLAHLNAGDLIVLQLYTGANANQRYQGYVVLKQEHIKTVIGALTTDDLDFPVNGTLFFIPS